MCKKMALGLLKRTPEAHIAAAITGHLGPLGPTATKREKTLDGVAFIAIALRKRAFSLRKEPPRSYLIVKKVFLDKATFESLSLGPQQKQAKKNTLRQRKERQRRASLTLLFLVRSLLSTD